MRGETQRGEERERGREGRRERGEREGTREGGEGEGGEGGRARQREGERVRGRLAAPLLWQDVHPHPHTRPPATTASLLRYCSWCLPLQLSVQLPRACPLALACRASRPAAPIPTRPLVAAGVSLGGHSSALCCSFELHASCRAAPAVTCTRRYLTCRCAGTPDPVVLLLVRLILPTARPETRAPQPWQRPELTS